MKTFSFLAVRILDNKKTLLPYIALVCLLIIFSGCSDNPTSGDTGNNGGTPSDSSGTTYNYTSDYSYNLNVIYFQPKNVSTIPSFRTRLSGFLLYIQDYYQKWMKYWGHDKTFGLLTDHGIVKIIYVKGKHKASAYPNSVSGAQAIQSEVKSYFAENSDISPSSKHYLVFTANPDRSYSFPYFGLGRWGFVYDFSEEKASTAEHNGGGVVHELGHALNLAHNAHRKSRVAELGTAIMHNGNNVWNHGDGASATSLTEASTDILNECQVFSKQKGDFYGPKNITLTKVSGIYKNGKIVVDGKFKSNVTIDKAIVILNPEGVEDYNQIGFSLPVISADSFHVSIDPKVDLFKNQDADYKSKLWLIPKHRRVVSFDLSNFTFTSGTPDINFHFGKVATLPKDNWSVIDFSDQEPTTNSSTGYSQLAKNIIDGNFDTFWHSEYSDVDPDIGHPHYLTVDMGAKKDVKGFQFVQRKGISAGAKRVRIKKLEIQISNDNANWQSLGNFELANTDLPQQIELDKTTTFRYFKLITKSSMYDGPRASLAEVGVY